MILNYAAGGTLGQWTHFSASNLKIPTHPAHVVSTAHAHGVSPHYFMFRIMPSISNLTY